MHLTADQVDYLLNGHREAKAALAAMLELINRLNGRTRALEAVVGVSLMVIAGRQPALFDELRSIADQVSTRFVDEDATTAIDALERDVAALFERVRRAAASRVAN